MREQEIHTLFQLSFQALQTRFENDELKSEDMPSLLLAHHSKNITLYIYTTAQLNLLLDAPLIKYNLSVNLSMIYDVLTDDILINIINKYPNIISLNINGCDQITSTGFFHINHLTKLQSFSFDYTNITSDDIKHLMTKNHNIKYLSCCDCNDVTSNFIPCTTDHLTYLAFKRKGAQHTIYE